MTKYYLDLPCVGEVPEAYKADSSELMTVSGVNIGNFAFRHALRFILKGFEEYRPVRYPEYQDAALRGDVEQTIVSCANWLGVSEQDEASNLNRARAFEASDAPTTCFGLGVQARVGEGVPALGPNTRRLAKVLSERAKFLSVRDELTRQTLEKIGVTNVVITGCPSNFINLDPGLGGRIVAQARKLHGQGRSWQEVRSVLSEFSGGHAASGSVLRESLLLMLEAPAFLVVQSPTLLPLLLRESEDLPDPYIANNPFNVDIEKLRQVLRASTLHFSSVEAWLDFSRTCDIAVGMRIHGTMVPLQAGVPAILISHDSRTAGLASHMGIPQIPAAEFKEICREGPERMLEEIISTMRGYDVQRANLASLMCSYVKANGLSPQPALEKLAIDSEKPHQL